MDRQMKILGKLDGNLTIFVPQRVWVEDNVIHFVDDVGLNTHMERRLMHFYIETLSNHTAQDALMLLFNEGQVELTIYDAKHIGQ